MTSPSGNELDSARLSEDSAAVLLARASQLDAASVAKVSIAELRQAARDAGIAPEAFEQALSEFRAASAAHIKPVAGDRRRRSWVPGVVLAAALLLLVALFLTRSVAIAPLP